MTATPRTVHLVVHTHWDREWYMTRQATLARAQQVMSRVCRLLDEGRLPGFLFDGQTVGLMDLLAVAEDPLQASLRRHVAQGRIAIGPWYVMADEFLVSGESLLRNLEIGRADAAVWQQDRHVGYLPDSFGHVAQMPEILRQFGITQAVLWRGADAQTNTFDWQAPSGAVAGTVFLPEGYYLHHLNPPDALTALPPLLQRIADRTPHGPLLLTQGGDHLAPIDALPDRVAAFNAAQSDWVLAYSTLPDHVDQALQASGPRERILGELRRNRMAFVLPDVLSTRRYIKRLHQAAEDRLLGETEPVLACLWGQAPSWPTRALERCWRLLLEQQAHDSLCGCSIDAVHAEVEQRFVELQQMLDALRDAALQASACIPAWRHEGPAGSADDRQCILFNPLPRARSGWWTVSLFLQDDLKGTPVVRNEHGQALPCAMLDQEERLELWSPLDDFPEHRPGRRVRLAVQADLPGLAWQTLFVTMRDEAATRQAIQRLDNSAWSVWLDEDGRLMLHDRQQPDAQPLLVISESDAGDSYNHSPPPQPHAVVQSRWSFVEGWRESSVQVLVLNVELLTPQGLRPDRQAADAAQVSNRGQLRLELRGDEPRLRATLDWDNRARDQRTRLLFPLDDGSTAPLMTGADSAFTWIEREARLASVPAEPGKQEMPVAVMPSLSALTAGRWVVAHRALHEFEVVRLQHGRALALTVVRSVGWLSRRDLRTRGVGAGPDLATPQAQCLGSGRDEFMLVSVQPGQAPRDAALAAAADLRRPALVLRGHPERQASPVEVLDPRLQISSVRRVGSFMEIRLWNPTSDDIALTLVDPVAQRAWFCVRADGHDRAPLPAQVPPHGVLTLRAAW